jgi:hypothetical protein
LRRTLVGSGPVLTGRRSFFAGEIVAQASSPSKPRLAKKISKAG